MTALVSWFGLAWIFTSRIQQRITAHKAHDVAYLLARMVRCGFSLGIGLFGIIAAQQIDSTSYRQSERVLSNGTGYQAEPPAVGR